MRDPTQPSWQVKYSDYGGLKLYRMVKNTYWEIANYYINTDMTEQVYQLMIEGNTIAEIAKLLNYSESWIYRIYKNKEVSYDATNFPLIGYEVGITNLLKQFRKDLLRPIRT